MADRKNEETIWEVLRNPGHDSAVSVILENGDCMVLRITGEDGEGITTLYRVFDGIYIAYNDFHMSECLSDFPFGNLFFSIEHCREGRAELRGSNGSLYYMEQGDMCVDSREYHSGACYFPLSHYHGITMLFQKDDAEKSLKKEFPGFSFDLAALSAKFNNEDSPFVVHNETAVGHLFYQLYQLPGRVQKDYFKVKVAEMLLYLRGMEPESCKVEKPYFYAGQVEKIRAIHELILSDLTKTYTAEELSRRFSISLTAMKRCFKSTYGSPIYTYLKQYRLNHAAHLLITRRDLKTSEVGAMVGYDSPSKFTAVFHEMMGETPLEYRKSHRSE